MSIWCPQKRQSDRDSCHRGNTQTQRQSSSNRFFDELSSKNSLGASPQCKGLKTRCKQNWSRRYMRRSKVRASRWVFSHLRATVFMLESHPEYVFSRLRATTTYSVFEIFHFFATAWFTMAFPEVCQIGFHGIKRIWALPHIRADALLNAQILFIPWPTLTKVWKRRKVLMPWLRKGKSLPDSQPWQP